MVRVAIPVQTDAGPASYTVEGKLAMFTRMLANAKESYEDYLHHFSNDHFLSEGEVDELAISWAYLEIILPHAYNAQERKLLFEILRLEKEWKERNPLDQLKVQRDGSVKSKELDHVIPISTEEAFRRYVQRAKKNGIHETLVRKGRGGKLPQRRLWTEVLCYLVILYSVCKPTKTSYKEIHLDLKNLIDDHPEVVQKGVTLLAPSTIGQFIREEAKVLISFAKDNPNDFKRKILGVLRFLPPSAPLVQIGVDGYHFQVVCADEETGEPVQLIAIVIYDFKSKAILGLAFGKTENNIVYRKAFQDYFKTTNNRLARQIVMDKFSAYTCSKVKNLNLLFKSFGVHLTRSSQPNNNARLERFFGTIQNFYQGAVLSCSYIGASITSTKTENARPCKKVQVSIRKKEYLKGESEMIHLLTHILKESYNKDFKALDNKSPMELFTREESNHIATLTDSDVAFGTLERHQSTIVGSGVMIKSGDHLYLYKKRSIEVATKFFKRPVDVYIDPSQKKSCAYIFARGKRVHLLKMPNLNIVPCAIFDRTESDKQFISFYNKETRELIGEFQRLFENMEKFVETELDGIDYKASRAAAKIKKDADGAFLQSQIGLTDIKPEPPNLFANGLSKLSSQKKKTKRTPEEDFAAKYNL